MRHNAETCITCRAEAAARRASTVAEITNAIAVLVGVAVIVGFCLLFGG